MTTETLSMFSEGEMNGMESEKFRRGSWWEIKHVHLDHNGKVDQRYTSVGQVVDQGMWDNQFRIDWQLSSLARGSTLLAGEPEEYFEETTVILYTGRHYTPTLGGAIWLSRIRSSRPLTGPEIDEFKTEQQAFYDEWCWTREEFDDWTRGVPDDPTGLWIPEFSNEDRDCDHGRRWSRTTDGTFCRMCKTRISDTALPTSNGDCMWWMYKGSGGVGEAIEHPDDCDWCERKKERVEGDENGS